MTCAKQIVTATVVSLSGEHFVGTNECLNPQPVCPRKDMPTGEGYHLCQQVCRQTAHAEVNALKAAGEAAQGGTLILNGHTYVCSACEDAAWAAGIVAIIIE